MKTLDQITKEFAKKRRVRAILSRHRQTLQEMNKSEIQELEHIDGN